MFGNVCAVWCGDKSSQPVSYYHCVVPTQKPFATLPLNFQSIQASDPLNCVYIKHTVQFIFVCFSILLSEHIAALSGGISVNIVHSKSEHGVFSECRSFPCSHLTNLYSVLFDFSLCLLDRGVHALFLCVLNLD